MKISLPIPKIQSKRVALRPLKEKDISDLLILHRDAETRRFAWVEHLQTPEQNEEWVDFQQDFYPRGLGIMAIESTITGDFIGVCGLRQRHDMNDAIDIVYRIMPDWRNQGYATEAAREVTQYGLGNLGLFEIIAQVHKANYASRRILYRLEFNFQSKETDEPWLLYRKHQH